MQKFFQSQMQFRSRIFEEFRKVELYIALKLAVRNFDRRDRQSSSNDSVPSTSNKFLFFVLGINLGAVEVLWNFSP